MAKKSFVLYYDQKQVIDELSDEQAGKLFKAIYEYNVNKKEELTGLLKIIFIPFKTTFDRDEIKWEETSKKRSEAGKKHTGNQYTRKKEMEQMEQNGTNGTVSVSVNDSVNVNVSESVSVNNIEPPHTPTEIFDYCSLIFKDCVTTDLKKKCEKMFNHYEATNWKNIYNWKKKAEEWVQDDIDKGDIRVKDMSRRLE